MSVRGNLLGSVLVFAMCAALAGCSAEPAQPETPEDLVAGIERAGYALQCTEMSPDDYWAEAAVFGATCAGAGDVGVEAYLFAAETDVDAFVASSHGGLLHGERWVAAPSGDRLQASIGGAYRPG